MAVGATAKGLATLRNGAREGRYRSANGRGPTIEASIGRYAAGLSVNQLRCCFRRLVILMAANLLAHRAEDFPKSLAITALIRVNGFVFVNPSVSAVFTVGILLVGVHVRNLSCQPVSQGRLWRSALSRCRKGPFCNSTDFGKEPNQKTVNPAIRSEHARQ